MPKHQTRRTDFHNPHQCSLETSLPFLNYIAQPYMVMHRQQLPITALPAWCKLNDVNFLDIKITDHEDPKGFGLVTECTLSSKDTFDIPTLLIIPHDLILNAEAVEEYAKVDHHFRQLLDAAGGKVCRR